MTQMGLTLTCILTTGSTTGTAPGRSRTGLRRAVEFMVLAITTFCAHWHMRCQPPQYLRMALRCLDIQETFQNKALCPHNRAQCELVVARAEEISDAPSFPADQVHAITRERLQQQLYPNRFVAAVLQQLREVGMGTSEAGAAGDDAAAMQDRGRC